MTACALHLQLVPARLHSAVRSTRGMHVHQFQPLQETRKSHHTRASISQSAKHLAHFDAPHTSARVPCPLSQQARSIVVNHSGLTIYSLKEPWRCVKPHLRAFQAVYMRWSVAWQADRAHRPGDALPGRVPVSALAALFVPCGSHRTVLTQEYWIMGSGVLRQKEQVHRRN